MIESRSRRERSPDVARRAQGGEERLMDERKRRIGENEVLYRAVNEKIESLNQTFATAAERMSVVCECGRGSCAQKIELDVSAYERVRADPTLFVVKPGHEVRDVEDIVERHEAYSVVRKLPGGPAELAVLTDPRE
jgi:hypothetical protein